MSLMAGTTLQSQKYTIQKLLHQSDFGSTYQARHTYLNQDVVLQTLNPVLRDRQDFAQIRQQFFSKVRSIAQQSTSARVLDCFEEGDLPFVVFELTAGQSPPLLVDWFPLMPHTVNPLSTVPESSFAPVPASAPAPASARPDRAAELETVLPISAGDAPTALPGTIATAETIPPAPAMAELESTVPTAATTPLQGKAFQAALVSKSPIRKVIPAMPTLAQSRQPAKGWMPLALIFISMASGLAGAGFGLSLRLGARQQASQTDPAKPNLPAIRSTLFSREQSFPSDQTWPISETPQFFDPDATPIEEPVYVTPADSYPMPSWEPLPTDPVVPDPQLSVPSPSSIQVTTSPAPALDSAPAPDAAPVNQAPPSGASAAQSLPSEPVLPPEPSLPALPDLPPVAPPALPEPAEPVPPAPAAGSGAAPLN